MCSEVAKLQALMEEFEAAAKALEEVLKDLEWRKPDVKEEEATLKELWRQAKTDPTVDVASQAIVVRVLRAILDDKLAEAERLERCMVELKAQLEALIETASSEGEVADSGETIR